MSDLRDLRGRTALVTGASSGMGAAWARALAERAAGLVLVARDTDALDRLAEELRAAQGVPVHVVTADLVAPDGAAAVHAATRSAGLDVHVLVNNAGFGLSGPFLEHALDREVQQVELDVLAVLRLCHLYGTDMRDLDGPSAIVNIASNAAFQPLPYAAVYAASKSFVLLLSEALGRELRGQGTRVLAVCPGPVATPFWGKIGSDLPRSAMVTPEQVVARALRALDRGRAVVVPSQLGVRAQALAPRFAPRRAVVAVSDGASRRIMMRGRSVTG